MKGGRLVLKQGVPFPHDVRRGERGGMLRACLRHGGAEGGVLHQAEELARVFLLVKGGARMPVSPGMTEVAHGGVAVEGQERSRAHGFRQNQPKPSNVEVMQKMEARR